MTVGPLLVNLASMGDSSSYEFRSRSAHLGGIAPSILDKERVSVRFELLPDWKPQWDRIVLSAAGQLATVGFLLLAPLIFSKTMQTALKFDVDRKSVV